ncbi:MAG: hypothetical protein RL748_3157 [Pseudomonadota bacterium]|jgi:flagellar protein FliO/FliZ
MSLFNFKPASLLLAALLTTLLAASHAVASESAASSTPAGAASLSASASKALISASTAVANPPATGIANLLQVISALILVVVIMLALAWALKNFGPKRLMGRVPVQVVGGVNLGGRERVLVIEVADQWIVIGTTPNQITTLATLPAQSLTNQEMQPGKPFSDWLKQIMEKKHG